MLRLNIILGVAAVAVALPPSYDIPPSIKQVGPSAVVSLSGNDDVAYPQPPSYSVDSSLYVLEGGPGQDDSAGDDTSYGIQGSLSNPGADVSYDVSGRYVVPVVCQEDEVEDALGNCVVPDVVRELFVFDEPEGVEEDGPLPAIPKPKVKVNVVVIRTDEEEEPDPVIIGPPEERTIVLVLSEKGEDEAQVIELPAPEGEQPQVYFVDYERGDNSLLPGNIYLQDALRYAATPDDDSYSPPQPQDTPSYYQ